MTEQNNRTDAVVHKYEDIPVTKFGEGIDRRYIPMKTIAQTWIEMKKGNFSPFHRHEDEQTVVLIKGKLRARSGMKGKEIYTEMTPGDVFVVPSNVIHQVEALEDSVFVEAFGPGPNLEKGVVSNYMKKQQAEAAARAAEKARTVAITYVDNSGTEHELQVQSGKTLMEAATENLIEGIIGECGGSCACATCHVIVDETWYDRLGVPGEMESDMIEALPLATKTSRLGCQIKVTEELDGLVLQVPEEQI